MKNPKGLISSVQEGLISPEQAQALNDAYTQRFELISSQITDRPDNRSSWYSLADLKSFLELAEKQASDLGYTMDGIRIYCGAYPTERSVVGYSTSFIVPTASSESENEGDGVSHDIPGANGLNKGSKGLPPSANYPQ